MATYLVVAVTASSHQLRSSDAPNIRGLTLWDHQPYFIGVTDFYGVHPVSEDFRIGDTLELLAAQHLPLDALIATLEAPHPFFQPNGLQFEAVRRDLHCCRFVWVPFLTDGSYDAAARALAAMPIDAVLLRSGGPSPINSELMTRAFPMLFDWREPTFRRVDVALTLGDGSRVSLWVSRRLPH